MSEPILKEKDGDVTTITLNRPEVGNRQTDATWAQLTEMLDIAAKESRLIVFKGAGDDFCLGREAMGQPSAVLKPTPFVSEARRFSISTARFAAQKFLLWASFKAGRSGWGAPWRRFAILRSPATRPAFNFPKWPTTSCRPSPCPR